jgi:hypothetical protein
VGALCAGVSTENHEKRAFASRLFDTQQLPFSSRYVEAQRDSRRRRCASAVEELLLRPSKREASPVGELTVFTGTERSYSSPANVLLSSVVACLDLGMSKLLGRESAPQFTWLMWLRLCRPRVDDDFGCLALV